MPTHFILRVNSTPGTSSHAAFKEKLEKLVDEWNAGEWKVDWGVDAVLIQELS